MPRYAILGPEGTFSEEAARAYWGNGAPFIYADSINEVFSMVCQGQADEGLVPLSNSVAGIIPATVKELLSSPLYIKGELHHRVSHCLLTNGKVEISQLELIISQPTVFLQCEGFLKRYLPRARREIVESTAAAAHLVKSEGKRAAAIGPRRTAELYGLMVSLEGLEDDPENCTTFINISREEAPADGCTKTSIIMGLPDRPGSLYHALGIFAERGVNLSRLESRPRGPHSSEYLFLVDIEGGICDPVIEDALNELKKYAVSYKYLGSYPAAKEQVLSESRT